MSGIAVLIIVLGATFVAWLLAQYDHKRARSQPDTYLTALRRAYDGESTW